jgi:hypothetical protein
LTAASVPIDPPAPARLSTITCCPNRSLNFCATMRPITSEPPPAGNGTMMRAVLAG